MASLTETAYYTRRAINWTILAIIIYIFLRILWSLLVSVWMILFPPRPAPPNHAFGKLPKLSFPSPVSSPSSQLTFTLETISGDLPIASTSGRVYFMPKQAPNLLAISQAQEFAKGLEFDPTPFQETRTVYRFNDPQVFLRKLRYDIVSKNFIMRYAYEQDPGIFTEGILNNPELVKGEAIRLLVEKGLYQADFRRGEQSVTFFKLVGNMLMPVRTISDTNAMRVDFFRGPVNTFKVMTPTPTDGQIQVLFSPSRDLRKRIVEVVYTFWPIDYNTFATYTFRPVAQAWQELQNGAAYIARYPINNTANIAIRNIYLAYYDTFEPQTYLQPIYVFEGDFEFKAYVPAVAPEWIE
jgi:hypothetical protein